MKNFKINLNKIKNVFSGNIVKIVITSVVTVIVFLSIIGLFSFHYRGKIFQYIAQNYIPKQQAQINLPILKEKESLNNINTTKVIKEPGTVVDAVKKAKPAVVSIITTKEVPKYTVSYKEESIVDKSGNPIPGVSLSTPIYTPDGTENKQLGGGSGFLVSKDGLIVTNNHVVSKKDVEYTVLLNNGKEYPAKVIARDSVLDIALVKITADNLPYLQFADSDKLDVGETVIAIGNALGEFRNTVSSGVVSGLSRSIVADSNLGQTERLDKVIQTDAAINPGNSGGPLLDLDGKVVGINVAVVDGSSSIAFSLPINSVKDVIDSVKKTGKIIRPYVGLRYVVITPELKEKYSLPVDYGIWVQCGATVDEPAVMPGSPAEKAGIKEEDFITEIDGVKIDSDNDFAVAIRNKKIGDIITMKVISPNEPERIIKVTLEQMPDGI